MFWVYIHLLKSKPDIGVIFWVIILLEVSIGEIASETMVPSSGFLLTATAGPASW